MIQYPIEPLVHKRTQVHKYGSVCVLCIFLAVQMIIRYVYTWNGASPRSTSSTLCSQAHGAHAKPIRPHDIDYKSRYFLYSPIFEHFIYTQSACEAAQTNQSIIKCIIRVKKKKSTVLYKSMRPSSSILFLSLSEGWRRETELLESYILLIIEMEHFRTKKM